MPAMTRGPLPARVYWVRRLVLLGTAVLLVIGIARVLDDGSDASSGAEGSAQLAAEGSESAGLPTPTSTTPSTEPTRAASAKPSQKASKKPQPSATPQLPAPVGTCADDDIAVTPEVGTAVAGRDVTIALRLRTLASTACVWSLSSDTIAMAITSGTDDVWSSRECPREIAVQDVVVRKDTTTTVRLTWPEARRSDETCSNRTEWAMPGWYHVTVAALSGEPSDVQFELGTPTAATITKTRTPKPSPSADPKASGQPKASASASGAVEPD